MKKKDVYLSHDSHRAVIEMLAFRPEKPFRLRYGIFIWGFSQLVLLVFLVSTLSYVYNGS